MSRDTYFDTAEKPRALRQITAEVLLDEPPHIPPADQRPSQLTIDLRGRQKTRFLQLFRHNKQRITHTAADLQVSEYKLIRYLLDDSLHQLQTETLLMEAALTDAEFTLYPDVPEQGLINTSCRGIPDADWQSIKAYAVLVPLWQVINFMLEHGLDQIENGQLRPQFVQIGPPCSRNREFVVSR